MEGGQRTAPDGQALATPMFSQPGGVHGGVRRLRSGCDAGIAGNIQIAPL